MASFHPNSRFRRGGPYLWCPALFLLSALLVSCVPKERNKVVVVSNTTESTESTESTKTAKSVFEERTATVIYDQLWFREEVNGKGVRQLDLGEVVTIIGETPVENDADLKQWPIRLSDGTEGFSNFWFVVPDSIPAVLVDEAKIYSEPKLTKLTTADPLQKMKIAAIVPSKSINGFVQINYTSEEGYAKLGEFVKDEFVSVDERDIAAAHLFVLGMKQDDEEMRREFLASASSMVSPAFGLTIDSALAEVTNPHQAISQTVRVIVDTAKIYQEPETTSQVIGSQVFGDILQITGQSSLEDLAEGQTAYWLSLESGGWIYGADVEQN